MQREVGMSDLRNAIDQGKETNFKHAAFFFIIQLTYYLISYIIHFHT